MERVRIGFIGCGSHASKNLIPTIPLVEQLQLVATCDLIEERARNMAQRYGVPKWYTDFEEMIEKERPDAVGLCGPPEMHTEIGIHALKLGVHIFIEKPPAISAPRAKRLVQAAEQAGKFGMVATMWRHAPAHRLAKEILQREEFGDPIQFHGLFIAPSPTGPKPDWGIDTVEWALLTNQGIHPVDCMRFLMGEVKEVYARSARSESTCPAREGATSFAINFSFESGAVGHLTLASGAPVLLQEIAVLGTGKRWVMVRNGSDLEYIETPTWSGTPGGYQDLPMLTWNPGTHYRGLGRHGYIEELEHFAQSILQGQKPHASLEDGYRNMCVLEAILKSIEVEKAVKVQY